jgi:hypothetical protein
LSARTASNLAAQAGDLNPVDALTAVLCGNSAAKTALGCPTNAPLQFIEQTSAGTQAGTANSAYWDINWTPPATDVGNVQIYVAGLAANGNGGNGGDDTATANYTLTPASTSTVPTLSVNPASLTFAASVGGSAPAAQTFQAGSSGSSLTFTTSTTTATGGNWLQATPSGGSTPLDVSVSVSPTGLAAGTYTGSVSVMSTGASNSPLPVAVTFTVSPVQGAPVLSATPSTISFTLPAGGVKASQTSNLSSTTAGLTFSAAATTASGGAWLSVTPAGTTTPSALQVTADPGALLPGSYSGTVSVTAAGAGNSPLPITVSLTVTNPALTLSPASLTFSSTGSGTVPSQTLKVGSSGSALTVTATASTAKGGNWLSVDPGGTTPASLNVSVNPSGLANATYTGAIAIASTGAANSPQSVAVTLVVGPVTSPPTSTDLSYRFFVQDSQSGGADRILLSGRGAIRGGVLTGGGDFNRFTPSSTGRDVTVSTGTWTATGIVSFTPSSGSQSGGGSGHSGDDFVSADDGGRRGNNNGGILVIAVNLLPTGGTATPATLRIADTGSDRGVTLTITGGDTFIPSGTGNVTITPVGAAATHGGGDLKQRNLDR